MNVKLIVNIMICISVPKGMVTFSRQLVKDFPKWESSQAELTGLHVASRGTIEDDGIGMLQVGSLGAWCMLEFGV